jgi:hypothetical protein
MIGKSVRRSPRVRRFKSAVVAAIPRQAAKPAQRLQLAESAALDAHEGPGHKGSGPLGGRSTVSIKPPRGPSYLPRQALCQAPKARAGGSFWGDICTWVDRNLQSLALSKLRTRYPRIIETGSLDGCQGGGVASGHFRDRELRPAIVADTPSARFGQRTDMAPLIRVLVVAILVVAFIVGVAWLFCAGLSEIVPVAACGQVLAFVAWLKAWLSGGVVR